jgi:hypothetical protein
MDMVLLAARDGAWSIIATPRYADRFARTTEGWRFAERVLTFHKAS